MFLSSLSREATLSIPKQMLIRLIFNLQYIHLAVHFAPWHTAPQIALGTVPFTHLQQSYFGLPRWGMPGGCRWRVQGLARSSGRTSQPKLPPGVPVQGNRCKTAGVSTWCIASQEASGWERDARVHGRAEKMIFVFKIQCKSFFHCETEKLKTCLLLLPLTDFEIFIVWVKKSSILL